MLPDWTYHGTLEPFERLGESFIVCSPTGMVMFTMSAEAIRQITSRREHFPKPTDTYEILALFGESVLTTEGALWRMHRKVTAASFNEKNAAHTFVESVRQARGMVETWLGPDGKPTARIESVERDTLTLALNIIGYVGFGMRLLWPHQTLPPDTDPRVAKYGSLDPPPGHTMSFTNALATVTERLIALLVFPWPLLKILPFKWARAAWEAQENYTQYMDEFLQDKISQVKSGEQEKEGMDIMGQLVRSKYGKGKDGSSLSDRDILGNAFIMIIAGHETTAGTLHFAMIELATNPHAQRAVQRDIDAIFGDTDPATWNYEQNINPLLASHVGATMNETLRLMPAVIEVPKHLVEDQAITLDGTKHVLPAGLIVSLCAVCVQRSPRYWPTQPSRIVPGASDVRDFEPERWYRTAAAGGSGDAAGAKDEVEGADTENYGGFQGPDTSTSLFRPVRGSFIPFSDGPRSCLGRRIAQVEMLAALAVVFQRYSIELSVDKWASDEEVERMGPEERRELYKKAQDESREVIKSASSTLTLRLHGEGYVPVRLVKRGEERFTNIVDLY